MAKANPSIGTCPCPTQGCKETCSVKKFAHKATTDAGRRNAGKLYIDCSSHGRFGFDGKQGMQDWILEHATINGEPPSPAPEKPAAAAPASAPANGAAALPSSAPAAQKQPKSLPWTLLG